MRPPLRARSVPGVGRGIAIAALLGHFLWPAGLPSCPRLTPKRGGTSGSARGFQHPVSPGCLYTEGEVMMLKAPFLAVLLLAWPSLGHAKEIPWQDEPNQKPNLSTMREAGEEAIRARLVDPTSAIIEWTGGFQWMYYKGFKHLWGWAGCGKVNSKNRMGGYAGPVGFVVVYNEGVRYADMEGRSDWISNSCAKFAPPQPELLVKHNAISTNSASTADELAKLAALRDKGILTEAEFQSMKAKLLPAN